jgi:hypothetical protein
MAKELPYFEFEPAEYLAGNISFCSLEAQGLFTLICCYYWQRSCSLTKEQFLKRMNQPKQLQELIDEGVIKIKNDLIVIDFLNEKYAKATKKSITNSKNGSKGGRPKKPKETETKPNALNSLSETKGIREDNIREDNIREREKIPHTQNDLDSNEKFLSWFNKVRTLYLEIPSNINRLERDEKSSLNILKESYSKEQFNIAMYNLCNNKWANESDNVLPKHFLKPDNFVRYLNMEKKPMISRSKKKRLGWEI